MIAHEEPTGTHRRNRGGIVKCPSIIEEIDVESNEGMASACYNGDLTVLQGTLDMHELLESEQPSAPNNSH